MPRQVRRQTRQQLCSPALGAFLGACAGSPAVDPVLSVSVLREPCQRRANHQDPVTTASLTGGEPGPVANARTAARARAPRLQGDTVTSPDSGAGTAADLPDYAPIPRSALGPALNDQRYYVGRVQRNLYWLTAPPYQSAFLPPRHAPAPFHPPPPTSPNLPP